MNLDPQWFGQVNRVVFPLGKLGPGGFQPIGTAFLTSVNGTFVTAAHTIGQDDSNLHLVVLKINSMSDYQDTSKKKVQIVKARVVAHDPFRDLSVLRADVQALSNLSMGGTDDLPVGSEALSFGFPHSDSGRMVLTYQLAEVGAKVLIESGGIKSKHIVLNTQARPGQSGSPIFRSSDLKLVAVLLGSYAQGGGGMVSLGGVDPHTLHQTTHAVSAEYIAPMLQQ